MSRKDRTRYTAQQKVATIVGTWSIKCPYRSCAMNIICKNESSTPVAADVEPSTLFGAATGYLTHNAHLGEVMLRKRQLLILLGVPKLR